LVSTVTGKLESTDRLQSIVLKIQSGTPQTLHQPCLYIKPVYSPAKLLYLIKCLFLFTFFWCNFHLDYVSYALAVSHIQTSDSTS